MADSIDTRTAAGRLVLNVLGSVAQWERETISERTTEALAHKKAKGERTGGVPFGYTVAADGKTLLQDPGEQTVIATIRAYREEGLSLRRICAIVHRQGIRSRRATALSERKSCAFYGHHRRPPMAHDELDIARRFEATWCALLEQYPTLTTADVRCLPTRRNE